MRKYKKTEEFLVVKVFLLSALCITQAVAVSIRSTKGESNVCKSKECVVAAASIITSMNLTQDPCQDFYSYVCGQYIRKAPEFSDHFNDNENLLTIEVRELLERPNSPSDPEAVKKARSAYKQCMNTTTLFELELTPLRNFVKSLGGWPIAEGEKWKPNPDSSIEALLGKIEATGYSSDFFKLTLAPDPTNPDVRIITLDQSNNEDDFADAKDAGVSRQKRENQDNEEIEQDDEETEYNTELIEATARDLFQNNNTDQMNSDANDFLKLSDEITAIESSTVSRRNQTRLLNKMSIKQLSSMTNNTFNWFSLLQNRFGKDVVPDENVIVNVKEVEYMKKLPVIFAQYGRTNITNLALWTAMSDLLKLVIDKDQEDIDHNERAGVCLKDVSKSMSFAMWRMVADNLIPKETIKNVEDLVGKLLEAFREIIGASKWLDTKTKDNALKKLNGMLYLVGYPKWVLKDDQLNAYYKDYVVTPNHFDNMITARKQSIQRDIRDFKKPVDRKKWPKQIGILTSNAFTEFATNTIYLPRAVLRPPFYNPNATGAINYGSIGAIIGHEIGHAFDEKGSQLDERGALREWWTKSSREIYTSRSQCFKNQYDGYCFNETGLGTNETCVDGELSLVENIPDNIGIQCAYKAYNKWLKTNSKEERMVGLEEFSARQLFFISSAYTWCENFTPEQYFLYDFASHSPGRYRVQGSLSNIPEFARAFQCKPGSMNRDKSVCALW